MERGEEEEEGGGRGLAVVVVDGGFEGGVQVGYRLDGQEYE